MNDGVNRETALAESFQVEISIPKLIILYLVLTFYDNVFQ
jgi:hypothetical protein